MNEAQRAAAKAWLEQWAAGLLSQASVFTRGSYQAFFQQHESELIEGIGNAVANTPSTPDTAPPD